MKDKFKKAREQAEDAITDEPKKPEDNTSAFPKRFDNFIKFAREKGIDDSSIFAAIGNAMSKAEEEKPKNRKNTKGAFGGKKKQKSKK
jgi:hypothetical protein